MFADISGETGTYPVTYPLMDELDWAQSGLSYNTANNDASTDTSLAQIVFDENSGGEAVTFFTPPDDGAEHNVTVYNIAGFETVADCDACTGGNVPVDPLQVGLGLHRATYEAEPQGAGCLFTLTCPPGTTAVCGTPSFNSGTDPCRGAWLNPLFVSVTSRRGKSCFGISPNVWSTTQGTCD